MINSTLKKLGLKLPEDINLTTLNFKLIQEIASNDYDMAFYRLENFVAGALGICIRNNIDQFIRLTNVLDGKRATSYKTKVELQGCDRAAYCVKSKDYRSVYIETQSRQYLYRIDKHSYHAREISLAHYKKPNDSLYFEYKDSRDEGYCGSLSMFTNECEGGLCFARQIKSAWDVIYHADLAE